MTASPVHEQSQLADEILLETSQIQERADHAEFEIIGLNPKGNQLNRAFPPFITIVKLDRVTVTVPSTVTTVYPVTASTDRVTLSISGCVPTDLPAAALNPC